MEICTLSNVVALAEEISLKKRMPSNSPLSKSQFEELVLSIFKEVEMFSKWRKPGQALRLFLLSGFCEYNWVIFTFDLIHIHKLFQYLLSRTYTNIQFKILIPQSSWSRLDRNSQLLLWHLCLYLFPDLHHLLKLPLLDALLDQTLLHFSVQLCWALTQ